MTRKALWLFVSLSCLTTILLIVPPTLATAGWTRTYSGEPMDILTPTSMVQTSDGGYAATVSVFARRIDNVGYQGHFTSFYELQIFKTSANGDLQWKQAFTKIDDPNHLTPTIYADSTVFVIVQTADQGYVIASSGNYAFWMFKVDSQGNVLWTKTYAYSEDIYTSSALNSMIQTNDGGFALAGSTDTSAGGIDFWLIKTDSKGQAQWNQTYNSGSYKDSLGMEYQREDVAQSLVQTRDGGYALVGSASLYRASTSSVVYASWLVKTDAQGKQQWNKGYDSPNSPGGVFSMVQTADGGYAVTGNQNQDFYLMKIDSTGQLQWGKTYGESESDTPCTVVQLNDGGYAVAGTWTKVNTTAQVSTMGLLRLDSSGQTVWTKTYTAKQNATTTSRDQANAMVLTSDGSYAIMGSTSFASETQQNVFLVKTETLEQPIQPTQTPTQTTPTATLTPTQPAQTQSPAPNQSQNSTNSNTPTSQPTSDLTSSPNPSPSVPEFPSWIILPAFLVIAAMASFGMKKRSRLN